MKKQKIKEFAVNGVPYEVSEDIFWVLNIDSEKFLILPNILENKVYNEKLAKIYVTVFWKNIEPIWLNDNNFVKIKCICLNGLIILANQAVIDKTILIQDLKYGAKVKFSTDKILEEFVNTSIL